MNLSSDLRARLLEAERRMGVIHRDGIPWDEAPLPRRLHRCSPWSSDLRFDRCACGGMRERGRLFWDFKNSRTKGA